MKFDFLCASLCFLSMALWHNLRANAEENQNNLLFIYVEDLGNYTSERASREPLAKIRGLDTPNLDKLASASVLFSRAFCGQSVCSPSKGAIYSGLAPHANGIWRNVHNAHGKHGGPENWIPLPSPLTRQNDPTNLLVPGMHEDLPNLVQLLKAKDIFCALSGKLHVQPARNFPYDVFVNEKELDAVIEMAGEKPWFFWCNPDQTHAPFWKSVKSKLVNPNDRNSPPKDVDPAAIEMLPWLPDTPASRIDLAQYYSNVRVIDGLVGELMQKLEASGQADRTIVVFTGDHGIPVQRGKTSIYPAGTHVSCFIKGPGVKAGRVISTPISQMDLNPTFLEAFGAESAEVCHGSSLWPILRGESEKVANRTTILTETNNSCMSSPVGGDRTMARAVCDGRYYYIHNIIQETSYGPAEKFVYIGSGKGEYGDPGALYGIDLHDDSVRNKETQPLPYELLRQLCMSDAPAEELYDLDSDPWGVNNLVGHASSSGILVRMRAELKRWREETGDSDVHPRTIPRREMPIAISGKPQR